MSALPPSEAARDDDAPLHALSSDEIVARFDDAEASITQSLIHARGAIVALGEAMGEAFARGGRVISVGAGTSGRLACLDAAEWPPTFGVSSDRVVPVLAGGETALREAVEGAEDDRPAGAAAIDRLGVHAHDLVVGLTASGTTPFVHAALEAADRRHATVALVTTHPAPPLTVNQEAIVVSVESGPEIVAGSTRLKAATATHRVLQRASVICAVRQGWVYEGRMVEMRPTNVKLRRRARAMVVELGGVSEGAAADLLAAADDDIKVALVCARRGCDVVTARDALAEVGRHLDRLAEFA